MLETINLLPYIVKLSAKCPNRHVCVRQEIDKHGDHSTPFITEFAVYRASYSKELFKSWAYFKTEAEMSAYIDELPPLPDPFLVSDQSQQEPTDKVSI